MTDPAELGSALVALADAFDALAVIWAIGGSFASAAHGEPRATNDIDVIAALDESSAGKLGSAEKFRTDNGETSCPCSARAGESSTMPTSMAWRALRGLLGCSLGPETKPADRSLSEAQVVG